MLVNTLNNVNRRSLIVKCYPCFKNTYLKIVNKQVRHCDACEKFLNPANRTKL